MERDVERIHEVYAAFARRKLEDVLMLMSEEVVIEQSNELPWGGIYCGHEGARQFFARLTEQVESRVEVEAIIDAGEQVVVIGRTIGKARATKLEFEVPVVHVWTVKEGQITRFQPYIDHGTMLAALRG